jgi:acetylornithine deacetylase/succinyl-diaminopimelate desuccinylase family protein
MEWIDDLRRAFDRDVVVELARDLVRIPSENPPGDESEVAAYLVPVLERLGLRDVAVVTAAENRASVTGRSGTPGGRVLIWNGHTDVVPVGDAGAWRHEPFGGTVAEDRLWGRGAVDMKGAIASVLAGLVTIRRAGLELAGELALQFVADEETGGTLGTAHLLRDGLERADGAIVGEPTRLEAVVAAKGLLWLELRLRGVSAHASQPAQGTNAIEHLAVVLQALRGLELGAAGHPLVGRPTVTPTLVSGGTKANIVPDRCTLTIDCRLPPGQSPEEAVGAVRALLAGLARTHGVDASVTELASWEASEVDPGESIVEAVQDATAQVLGRRAPVAGMTGSTDARYLVNDARIPTVIFGPGSLEQAHTTDEWIAVEQLELGCLAYAATLCRFLGVR